MKARVRCVRLELNGREVLRALEGEVEGAGPELSEAIGDLVALMLSEKRQQAGTDPPPLPGPSPSEKPDKKRS